MCILIKCIFPKRADGLKKFEIDIGQLINTEETEEKLRQEKLAEDQEIEANKVNVLYFKFRFYDFS